MVLWLMSKLSNERQSAPTGAQTPELEQEACRPLGVASCSESSFFVDSDTPEPLRKVVTNLMLGFKGVTIPLSLLASVVGKSNATPSREVPASALGLKPPLTPNRHQQEC